MLIDHEHSSFDGQFDIFINLLFQKVLGLDYISHFFLETAKKLKQCQIYAFLQILQCFFLIGYLFLVDYTENVIIVDKSLPEIINQV